MPIRDFDHAVLDSGDIYWQPWMVGYDWTPAMGYDTFWVPSARARETPPRRHAYLPGERLCGPLNLVYGPACPGCTGDRRSVDRWAERLCSACHARMVAEIREMQASLYGIGGF